MLSGLSPNPQQPAEVLPNPDSRFFGRQPPSTNIEAPTVLSWGFFSSDGYSSRVFAPVRAKACGLRRSAIWRVLGRLSLSLFRAIKINNLRADE
jgi:hypothetical protein